MHLLHHLDRLPRGLVLGLSTFLMLGITTVDYYTGRDLSFHIFYLAPVVMAAWVAGAAPGAVMAGACALGWQLTDVLTGRAYELAWSPYWNLGVRFSSFMVVSYLLAALRSSWNHERELARTDDLTGVQNARSFNELAHAELHRSRRFGRPITIGYIDLDNFKQVNDTLGHSAGDAVLRAAAQAIVGSLRAVDVVARLGGDEFGILLPETSAEMAKQVLHKLHRAIAESTMASGSPVSASIGAITCRELPPSVDDLIRMADERMYLTKRNGKNQIYHEVIEGEKMLAGSPIP
ncbi:MAG: GGDEF domain-containing protein [Gemmatimonadales bacterium]